MDYNYFVAFRIVTSENPIDLNINPAYTPFTQEQNEFYAEHPNATYWEVKNCEMAPEPVLPTLDDVKLTAKEFLSQLSLDTMRKYVKEYQMENAQSSLYLLNINSQAETIYDETKANEIMETYTNVGRELRGIYKTAESAVNNCETIDDVNSAQVYYENIYNNYNYNIANEETT